MKWKQNFRRDVLMGSQQGFNRAIYLPQLGGKVSMLILHLLDKFPQIDHLGGQLIRFDRVSQSRAYLDQPIC